MKGNDSIVQDMIGLNTDKSRNFKKTHTNIKNLDPMGLYVLFLLTAPIEKQEAACQQCETVLIIIPLNPQTITTAFNAVKWSRGSL